MPSLECENGKWKWGENGSCKYETKEESDADNQEYKNDDQESSEIKKDMKSEKRHVKEIIEDDETITIVYNKNEDFEGIKIKESDTPDEGPEETIEDPIEENNLECDDCGCDDGNCSNEVVRSNIWTNQNDMEKKIL